MATCKSCGGNIVWLKNVLSEKVAPIDAEPVPGGNIRILGNGYYGVIPAAEAYLRSDLHKSHFATCLDAQLHRTRK